MVKELVHLEDVFVKFRFIDVEYQGDVSHCSCYFGHVTLVVTVPGQEGTQTICIHPMSFLVLSYLERYYISLGEEASTSSQQVCALPCYSSTRIGTTLR
jgi:hypothetical protein